jgi:hypothetical protein
MRTVHSLKIDLWIPIAVEEDDNISCGKIDTETTSTGTEQKGKFAGPVLIEFFHLRISAFTGSAPVNATVRVSNQSKVIF